MLQGQGEGVGVVTVSMIFCLYVTIIIILLDVLVTVNGVESFCSFFSVFVWANLICSYDVRVNCKQKRGALTRYWYYNYYYWYTYEYTNASSGNPT